MGGVRGLELELFGTGEVIIRSVPAVVPDPQPERLLEELLEELEGGGTTWTQNLRHQMMAATMACHSAIRGGDRITAPEAMRLLEQVQEAAAGGHCPHGRPVTWFLPNADLARHFNRA